MKQFLIALQLLTIIPVKTKGSIEDKELGKSAAFFPLIGAVQGIILVGANIFFSLLFPLDVVSALILIALMLTNGGFHLDGFADTVDGLAGGSTKEERLHIMKDSSIGAIGVMAIILLLLLKFLAINSLNIDSKNYILFLLPVIGRWSMVAMAYWADYAREGSGLGKAFTEYTGIREFFIATTLAILFSLFFLRLKVLAYLIILLFTVYVITVFFKKKLGGVTGDVLGFQSEAAEAIFLLLVIMR